MEDCNMTDNNTLPDFDVFDALGLAPAENVDRAAVRDAYYRACEHIPLIDGAYGTPGLPYNRTQVNQAYLVLTNSGPEAFRRWNGQHQSTWNPNALVGSAAALLPIPTVTRATRTRGSRALLAAQPNPLIPEFDVFDALGLVPTQNIGVAKLENAFNRAIDHVEFTGALPNPDGTPPLAFPDDRQVTQAYIVLRHSNSEAFQYWAERHQSTWNPGAVVNSPASRLPAPASYNNSIPCTVTPRAARADRLNAELQRQQLEATAGSRGRNRAAGRVVAPPPAQAAPPAPVEPVEPPSAPAQAPPAQAPSAPVEPVSQQTAQIREFDPFDALGLAPAENISRLALRNAANRAMDHINFAEALATNIPRLVFPDGRQILRAQLLLRQSNAEAYEFWRDRHASTWNPRATINSQASRMPVPEDQRHLVNDRLLRRGPPDARREAEYERQQHEGIAGPSLLGNRRRRTSSRTPPPPYSPPPPAYDTLPPAYRSPSPRNSPSRARRLRSAAPEPPTAAAVAAAVAASNASQSSTPAPPAQSPAQSHISISSTSAEPHSPSQHISGVSADRATRSPTPDSDWERHRRQQLALPRRNPMTPRGKRCRSYLVGGLYIGIVKTTPQVSRQRGNAVHAVLKNGNVRRYAYAQTPEGIHQRLGRSSAVCHEQIYHHAPFRGMSKDQVDEAVRAYYRR
ncbi:MAG: hypothetical protein M1829_004803 [Trizodia sp. TS-e1964]|nr:MAG: hypothetical protein M1829_004803 [Trizodia sp. TS-e1964]